MKRFILISFLVLAWGYYELSGGRDFVAERRPVADAGSIGGISNADVEAALARAGTAPTLPEPAAAPAAEAGEASTIPAAPPAEQRAVAPPVAEVADPDPATALPVAEVADPDPATALPEPAADAGAPTFVSLSESLDGTALTATEPAPEPAAAPAAAELRAVDADRLNVRSGPSTGDGVIAQLTRGEVVALVSSNDDGWSLIRLEGDGLEGWVANDFLAEN